MIIQDLRKMVGKDWSPRNAGKKDDLDILKHRNIIWNISILEPGHQLYCRKTKVMFTHSTTDPKHKFPKSELWAKSGPPRPPQIKPKYELDLEVKSSKYHAEIVMLWFWKSTGTYYKAPLWPFSAPVTPLMVSAHATDMIIACTIAVAIQRNWTS